MVWFVCKICFRYMCTFASKNLMGKGLNTWPIETFKAMMDDNFKKELEYVNRINASASFNTVSLSYSALFIKLLAIALLCIIVIQPFIPGVESNTNLNKLHAWASYVVSCHLKEF